MKKFNLEQAKAGKPVCTKRGYPAMIWDFNYEYEGENWLVCCVQSPYYEGNGFLVMVDETGSTRDEYKNYNDLMMMDVE